MTVRGQDQGEDQARQAEADQPGHIVPGCFRDTRGARRDGLPFSELTTFNEST